MRDKDDCISRQAAIDAVGDWIYNPEDLRYHKDVINSIPAVQPDHTADIGKKVSISCGHENDPISRQMAIDTIMGQPPEPHYPSWYAAQIEELPAVQPEIIRCKDCKHADFGGLSDLYCMWNECHMYEDDYCSYAERENET